MTQQPAVGPTLCDWAWLCAMAGNSRCDCEAYMYRTSLNNLSIYQRSTTESKTYLLIQRKYIYFMFGWRRRGGGVFSQNLQSGPGLGRKMWIVSSLIKLNCKWACVISTLNCTDVKGKMFLEFFFSSIYCDWRRFDPAHLTLSLHCAKNRKFGWFNINTALQIGRN